MLRATHPQVKIALGAASLFTWLGSVMHSEDCGCDDANGPQTDWFGIFYVINVHKIRFSQ